MTINDTFFKIDYNKNLWITKILNLNVQVFSHLIFFHKACHFEQSAKSSKPKISRFARNDNQK